MQNQSQFAI